MQHNQKYYMKWVQIKAANVAFTLVEMSIVLIIIGLVVGGILVGTDLVKSATVRGQVKQMQMLQSQVATFRDKYGCLPGDCTNATTFFGTTDMAGHTVSNGDGDGLIRSTVGAAFGGYSPPYAGGVCVYGGMQGTELTQFFLHLDDANIGNYTSDGTSYAMTAGWNANQVINNGTGLLVTCLAAPVGGGVFSLDSALGTGNVIVLGAFPNVIGGSSTNRVLYIVGMASWGIESPLGIPVDYANMIDQKIDDGLPASGSFGVIGAYGSSGANPGTACLTNSNTTYPALSSSTCNATAGLKLGL